MKQFYKINEISKLYNIGPDSLRYYEKLGLLAPKRGKNNYRLYTLDDLWRLNIIRDLRRLGFPMEKIREYMDNRSVENTRKLLTEELDAIHQQIQELNRLQKNVEERLQTLSGAEDQTLLKIRLQTFPDRYCHTLNTPYHTDEEMDLLVKQLLNKNTENLYIISNHNIGSFLPLKEINNLYSRTFNLCSPSRSGSGWTSSGADLGRQPSIGRHQRTYYRTSITSISERLISNLSV